MEEGRARLTAVIICLDLKATAENYQRGYRQGTAYEQIDILKSDIERAYKKAKSEHPDARAAAYGSVNSFL